MEVETQATPEKSFVTPSFGAALGGALKGEKVSEPASQPSEVEAKAETPETPAPELKAEPAATPAPVATAPAAAVETPAPEEAAGNPRMVPVTALQKEREKRQVLEALVAQYETQPPPAAQVQQTVEPTDLDPVQTQIKNLDHRFLNMSEKAARRAHSDFEPAYQAFLEASKSNPELARLVVDSDDPGEAAYQTGQNLLLGKKYNVQIGDLVGLRAAIEKEVREDERKKANADHEANLAKLAADRSKTPTDISQGRAAGGTVVAETSPQVPSFGSALQSVFNRR